MNRKRTIGPRNRSKLTTTTTPISSTPTTMSTGHPGAVPGGKRFEKGMLVPDLRTEDKGREGPLAMVLGLSVLHHAGVPILPSLLSFHQEEGM